MKLDDYIKIITLTSSIIAIFSAFYKFNKSTKMSEEYFDKVVMTYVKEYKKNRSINSIKFIKRRFTIGDYFVPSYIFYLVDQGNSERLHKVLIVDYRDKFPHKMNTINKVITEIGRFVLSVIILGYYFFFTLGVLTVLLSVIMLVISFIFTISIDMSYVYNILKLILLCIAILFAVRVFVYEIIVYDDYNMKIKYIKKLIKRKENQFNKGKNYYIN